MLKKMLLLVLLSMPLFGEEPSISLLQKSSGENEIVVNNRIIVKINGKPLTVVDVVKKMDLHFYRQYPHLIGSPTARYEFYMASFQYVFSALVNDLLVVADAEEKKVEVTDGDVREEMEKIFGPDVVENIDKLQLSFEEAWELLKRELIVQQMTGMMVRSRAMSDVQPKTLKTLYEEFIKSNPQDKEWTYQILTVKGPLKEGVEAAIQKIYQELQLQTAFPAKESFALQGVDLNISEEFVRKEREISKAHKEALDPLTSPSFSAPLVQFNRKENLYVGRIFNLKACKDLLPPSFLEMEGKLHQEVLEKAINRHSIAYSEKLRQRYGMSDEYLAQMIPPDFKPFALR